MVRERSHKYNAPTKGCQCLRRTKECLTSGEEFIIKITASDTAMEDFSLTPEEIKEFILKEVEDRHYSETLRDNRDEPFDHHVFRVHSDNLDSKVYIKIKIDKDYQQPELMSFKK